MRNSLHLGKPAMFHTQASQHTFTLRTEYVQNFSDDVYTAHAPPLASYFAYLLQKSNVLWTE